MTTHEVLSIIFAALTFEAILITTIVAIVVAIIKKLTVCLLSVPDTEILEFGTDDENEIHVSFEINATKVIPEKALSLTKTGKLSEKAMSKTAYYDLPQDYVCSCALRIARDMFALLPVRDVYVHVFENRLNSSTGHEEKLVILSARYDLPTVNHLNFDQLDPSDALTNFQHAMSFKKTKGFEEVQIIGG
jgi:hypothetical protein